MALDMNMAIIIKKFYCNYAYYNKEYGDQGRWL